MAVGESESLTESRSLIVLQFTGFPPASIIEGLGIGLIGTEFDGERRRGLW